MVTAKYSIGGVEIMNELGCDYQCRTVGEGIVKYNIPNYWCAEFDACENAYPVICVQVERIRKTPALLDIKLRVVENPNEEYAGCIVSTAQKIITFKVECMSDLLKALETECKSVITQQK